jgi:hypothetical protein
MYNRGSGFRNVGTEFSTDPFRHDLTIVGVSMRTKTISVLNIILKTIILYGVRVSSLYKRLPHAKCMRPSIVGVGGGVGERPSIKLK